MLMKYFTCNHIGY